VASIDPEKTARALFACLNARDAEGLAALMADDIEFDLAFGRSVIQPTKGRDAVIDVLTNVVGKTFDPLTLEVTAAYPCADDRTVVLEYVSDGTVVHNGNRYTNEYAGIFRVNDDGLLEWWKEFHNPEETARALGV
jgi:ketosteroid isomerase-like protein